MPVFFADSSGVVKRYASETGSAWVTAITNSAVGNEIFIVRVSAVEVVSALARRIRGGSIVAADGTAAIAQFKKDLKTHYQVIEITEALIGVAMSLAEMHFLRG